MAKRTAAPDMIEEIEGAAERMASWIGENVALVIGVLVLVLGSALAWGAYQSVSTQREEAASNALEKTRFAYFAALGAPPGAIEEPELANPQAAQAIREDFLERFRKVSEEHDGTVAGTLAVFEMARLLDKLEQGDEAMALFDRALAAAEGNPGLTGLLQQRVAETLERREDWDEASAAHEAAGELEGYPLRYWALADAARCAAAAGQNERALALYERVEQEAPELELPAHLRAQLRELRALEGS